MLILERSIMQIEYRKQEQREIRCSFSLQNEPPKHRQTKTEKIYFESYCYRFEA